jgi:hypothetical protein
VNLGYLDLKGWLAIGAVVVPIVRTGGYIVSADN